MTSPAAKVETKRPPPLLPVRPAGLCTRWVVTLMFQGYGNDAIRAALAADDLPCPSDAALRGMRKEYLPKKFRLKSPRNVALFERLGIAQLIPKTTPEADEAVALLRQPRVRELVEAALIVGVPVRTIVQALSAFLKYEASVAAVALFHNTLFDTLALSRGQLRVAVHERIRLSAMRLATDPEDEAAARRAVAADARTVATSLPATPLAWASILLSLGFAPARHELVDVIAEMETLATLRANECLLRGESGDERRAEAFTNVLQKVHEIRQIVISPESQLSKQLMSFRLAHNQKPLTTVQELRDRGDEVSVDILGPPVVEYDGGNDIVDNVEARPLAANGTLHR